MDQNIFGEIEGHMNAMNMQMRNMNRLMNSFMPDPFNMLSPFDNHPQHQNALMDRQMMNTGGPFGGLFGFPPMPNINRLLNADISVPPNGASFCSSSVISMSSGPDGRPQIYQATQTTKTGPGGIRETRKTVQDSTKGIKKMAIGHHIGERAHIIEKEQDLRSGQLEERQEFINLEEEQAEDFDREFTNKATMGLHRRPHQREVLMIEPADDADDNGDDEDIVNGGPGRRHRRQLPSLPPATSSASTSGAAAQHHPGHNSIHHHPYNVSASRRSHHRASKHSKGQQPPSAVSHSTVEIEEIDTEPLELQTPASSKSLSGKSKKTKY